MTLCLRLLTVFAVLSLFCGIALGNNPGHPGRPGWWKFSIEDGYFEQSSPATSPNGYDFKKRNFGLISRPYDSDRHFDPEHKLTQWQRFGHKLGELNKHSNSATTRYKLIYAGRHGEGWHNVAEGKYGTALWNCKYSLLNGADGMVWYDAVLTPLGVNQTIAVHNFWKHQLLVEKMPAPERYYVSPLRRTIMTAMNEFGNLPLPPDRPFRPIIKEKLREILGIQTCNKRHPRSNIARHFPSVRFEPHFSEPDLLWKPDIQESGSEIVYRLRQALNEIFTKDSSHYLSFTSHSGATMALLAVVGHQSFPLATSGQIPLLVKGEWIEGPEPRWPLQPGHGVPACPAPGAVMHKQKKKIKKGAAQRKSN